MTISPTLEVVPEVRFLHEMVQLVSAGKVKIPDFQRRFVWRRGQMLDLLDSIRNQYPIGSLLVWESSEDYHSMGWVGPIRVLQAQSSTSSYVLDGHQRLSTLAGVLLPSTEGVENPEDIDPNRWVVWFNAKDDVFEHPKDPDAPKPWHFPMSRLLDTIAFLEESQRMLKEGGEAGRSYVQRVQQIARDFQTYKLPVVRIKYTDLEHAVDIFARLNSKGQQIDSDQMASAMLYSEGQDGTVFNLASQIDSLKTLLEVEGFGDVDRTAVLRALLASLQEDIYTKDWTKLAKARREDLRVRLSAEVDATRGALALAVGFLKENGVRNARLLPYSMQLVVLSAFFRACPTPTTAQREFLKKWFWVSSFTGWFGSGNPSRISGLVVEFRESVAQEAVPKRLENMRLDEPALPFPKVFDMRSARVRAFLMVLLGRKPRDAQGGVIDSPWSLIGRHGPSAIGYVAATVKASDLSSSPANRIVKWDVQDRAQAKNWLLKLSEDEEHEVLASHAIPQDAIEALRDNDGDGFVRARQRYLIELEVDFMKQHGVVPPRDVSPQAAPIDTGE